MSINFKTFLWLLKLGALLNLYFLVQTFRPPLATADARLIIPAQIFFIVSMYRCLFPVRYKNHTVFHRSPFSSIFITRFLATFSEIGLIYLLAQVIGLLNVNDVGWVTMLTWWMVAQVVVSQVFVWGEILTGRLMLFVYEELGWFIIYALNSLASVYLWVSIDDFNGRELFIYLNLLFGVVYLPWQLLHLRDLRSQAQQLASRTPITWAELGHGLRDALTAKNQTAEAKAWGGGMGVIWMTAYWATLIPMWVYVMAQA